MITVSLGQKLGQDLRLGFQPGKSAPIPPCSVSDELTGTVVTLRRPNPLDYPPHQPRMRRNKLVLFPGEERRGESHRKQMISQLLNLRVWGDSLLAPHTS